MTAPTLNDEIKQTRPFATPSQEATVAIMRTAHLLRRRVEALVSGEGISSQQYNVLRILRGARSPLPTMEISERMIEPACGITRLIGSLEQNGFVRREQWAGDRRQVLCQITPAGLRLLDRLEEQIARFDDAIGTTLAPAEITVLLDLLTRVRHRIDE